jgi:NADH:ubiquinone oxidoreductase subunit 6 (subunit J)
MMSAGFWAIAVVTLAGAAAAMTLRNPVHCALSLVIAFAGLAVAYLQLGAEFVSFAQILVYIGAVAILIVFAILLTRSSDVQTAPVFSGSWVFGAVVCVAVFAALASAIRSSNVLSRSEAPELKTTVQQLGMQLFQGEAGANYVLPLEAVGLLLTAALIGAAVIAVHERPKTS